ncbi:MAG: hypothetical protein ACOYXM_06270 [Actinomycetota bacterium]
MYSTRRARTTALALLLALAPLAACGGEDKVGDDDLLAFDQEQANQLGASSTTETTASPIDDGGAETTAAPTQTTAAPQTTLPPEQQQVTVEVVIQDDEQGAPFTPNVVRVAVGGRVRFLNKGTRAYSIVAQNGAFASPSIAPGQAWIYEATTPGNFNYSDDVRTYSQGTIQVVA